MYSEMVAETITLRPSRVVQHPSLHDLGVRCQGYICALDVSAVKRKASSYLGSGLLVHKYERAENQCWPTIWISETNLSILTGPTTQLLFVCEGFE